MKQHRPHSEKQRARERALFLYGNALERGDFSTVEAVLRQAETDPALESMLAAWDEAMLLRQSETDLTLEGLPIAADEAPAPAFSQSDAAAVAIVHQQFKEYHTSMHVPPDETQDLPEEQPAGMVGEQRAERGGQEPPREAPAVPTPLYLRRVRRLFSWTAAVAAVLAIVIITGALFVSHRPSTGTPSTPIAKTSQPTPTPPSGVYINTYNGAPGSPPGAVYALNPSDGTTLWSVNEPAGVHIVARPVLYHGALYTLWEDLNNNTSGIVTAFDAKSGKQLWTVALHSVVDNVTLTLVNGVIYLGLRNGQVVALDANLGALRWRSQTSDDAMVSLVADGTVYVESMNSGVTDTLYALNASDGSARWHFLRHAIFGKVEAADGQVYFLTEGSTDNPQPPGSSTASSAACCQSQSATLPAVGNSGGSGNTILYILDPATGSVRWSDVMPADTLSDFEASGNLFYLFPNAQSTGTEPVTLIIAYDASTHQERWRFSVASSPTAYIYSAALMNGVLYLTANDTLFALNLSTGAHLWQVPMASGTLCDLAGCSLDQSDDMYVATGLHVYALHRADGSLAWSSAVPQLSEVAAVSSQAVYVSVPTIVSSQTGLAQSGGILVLSASDGTLLWRHDIDAEYGGPVVG